jgi:hypothetical protein
MRFLGTPIHLASTSRRTLNAPQLSGIVALSADLYKLWTDPQAGTAIGYNGS